jgi:hypothetical protein
VHLGESVEYPIIGWLWPVLWLLALASTAAGVPRALTIPKYVSHTGLGVVIRGFFRDRFLL